MQSAFAKISFLRKIDDLFLSICDHNKIYFINSKTVISSLRSFPFYSEFLMLESKPL